LFRTRNGPGGSVREALSVNLYRCTGYQQSSTTFFAARQAIPMIGAPPLPSGEFRGQWHRAEQGRVEPPQQHHQRLRQRNQIPARGFRCQREAMTAVAGTDRTFWHDGIGLFPAETPFANDAGIDVIRGPRDYAAVRQALASAGYNGERIVVLLLAPR
jgi:hypothetical protein